MRFMQKKHTHNEIFFCFLFFNYELDIFYPFFKNDKFKNKIYKV